MFLIVTYEQQQQGNVYIIIFKCSLLFLLLYVMYTTVLPRKGGYNKS